MGIFIGNVKTGKVTGYVPHPDLEQRDKGRVIGWSDVAIDFKGTLYMADVASMGVRQLVKVKK